MNQTNISKDVRIADGFFWVPFLLYTPKFDVKKRMFWEVLNCQDHCTVALVIHGPPALYVKTYTNRKFPKEGKKHTGSLLDSCGPHSKRILYLRTQA